jgi:hypothetical protein
MRNGSQSLAASLVLAGGILAGTAVSLMSARSLSWALAGPAVLAMAVVASVVIRNRVHPQGSAVVWIMAGTVVIAGGIVALSDPSSVPILMPILGASTVVALTTRRTCVTASPGPGGRP